VTLTPYLGKGTDNNSVVVLIDDLTEKRKLLASRRMFEKMVSPAVIQLLDPDKIHLGGQRVMVSVLFADLSGFTRLGEKVLPEVLVSVINDYLAFAADEILKEEGTIDKFLGDAVLAWFNAPLPQEDHILRAVRTAWNIQQNLELIHKKYLDDYHLFFRIGIHTGDAVLGLIGSDKRMEYTAIGDCVNTAKRLQESAKPGQILVSEIIQKTLGDAIQTSDPLTLQLHGKQIPFQAYSIIGVTDP
jgi:class 3 adenylate cyclase